MEQPPEPLPNGQPLVIGSNLGRRYGSRWALAGANLQLRSGRSLLIGGHNGAGKTTLLRILATTLRPTRGELIIDGIDVARDPIAARQRIGMLAHQSGLYPELTAIENLRVVGRLLGIDAVEDRAAAMLKRVGLGGRERDRLREFSAGMRKRLAFAKLLLQDPQLVLLDEPYGQLDPQGFDFVDGLLKSLVAEGRAVVVVTHLVERVAPQLHSGLLLDGGEMRWTGVAAELPAAMGRWMLR
ncbi:MAG: heme ABC exporter ATP-binding protein CcmA [Deltaproteobacteria bacterium]|nr:heme ABC exporter ATP-binding protein CcmA [Deltaproteobacteria bacterium]